MVVETNHWSEMTPNPNFIVVIDDTVAVVLLVLYNVDR
jgi:hypothetical protein